MIKHPCMRVMCALPVYHLVCSINTWRSKMAKRPASDGAGWSASELKTLKKLAAQGTAADAAKTLGRTAAAVQQKAMRSGISFRKSRRAAPKKK